MKDLDVKWEDAPNDTAVYITSPNGFNTGSGWFTFNDLLSAYVELSSRQSKVYVGLDGVGKGWYKVHARSGKPIPSKAEWMPVVGEECEVESDIRDVWVKGMYVGIDSIGSHVFDVEKKHLWRIDSISVLVRPLKTAEEKKREAFKVRVIEILSSIHKDDFTPEEIASVLDECGYESPEGGR